MSKLTSIPQYCAQVVASVGHQAGIKAIGAAFLMLFAFAFGDGATTVLEAISILIFFDFFTAISAVKIRGERIESAKVFRSVIKFLMYMTMIASGHLFEIVVPFLGTYATDIIAAFLAITELISILENIGKMGFHIPLKLLNALQNSQEGK